MPPSQASGAQDSVSQENGGFEKYESLEKWSFLSQPSPTCTYFFPLSKTQLTDEQTQIIMLTDAGNLIHSSIFLSTEPHEAGGCMLRS